MEADLVPYKPTTCLPAARVLVLAPHADDETFGCGGAIAAHVRAGTPVHLLVLTDGAAYGAPGVREDECRAAARALGCEEPVFWRVPDRTLWAADLDARVVAWVGELQPDLVYAPSPWEVHPDHRAGASLAARAASACGAAVAFYELGAPVRPNALVDITPHLETKRAAAACYPSQLAQQDYAGQLFALNRYRTYSLPAEVEAAEAFLVLSPAEIENRLPGLLAGEPVSAGALTVADRNRPLVSVLVRSIDRETLREALDSVAVQTWPAIEVVVVAAQPGHRDPGTHCGPFPLRLVPTDVPLARSATANRATEHARGDLLLFLDDDDWLMPGHVERLATVLGRQPQAVAAYTGVVLTGVSGAVIGQVMDLPFDAGRQLVGNLMPIHGVMFRRSVLQQGCRFDESLDRYEDWDFWLQVSRVGAFTHLPGTSAAYRIHESSGVHVDSGPGGTATRTIYEKWREVWDAGRLEALMRRAWATEEHEQRKVLLEAEIARLRAIGEANSATIARQGEDIRHLLAEIDIRQRDLDALRASTSWRVTAPLRWLVERLRGRREPSRDLHG